MRENLHPGDLTLRGLEGPARLGSPVGSTRKGKAFTLVELLIVVGIIALLVTIIMPSLGRAKDLAKKAVCASQMRNWGPMMALYLEDYETYPPVGWPGSGWPKFYGLLVVMEVEAPLVNAGSLYFPIWVRDYGAWEADEVPDGCFCPAMDWVSILRKADATLVSGQPYYIGAKPALHRAAAGYQWNPCLRGPGRPNTCFPSGRWPMELWAPNTQSDWYNTHWTDCYMQLPEAWYVAQAVRPDEIDQPARVAEAVDGWDIGAVPEVNWYDLSPTVQTDYKREHMVPGWHVGPETDRGWALLNGARHPTGPNILYADGHVACDANEPVPTNQLSPLPGSATWKGAKVVTWPDWDDTFGTTDSLVPNREFITNACE